MLLDRERSFNPLQADRVRAFDSAHFGSDGPVRDENGAWLIFEDGSARDLYGDRLDPADQLSPKERRRWQIFWCKKKIPQLSELFRRQRMIALQTLSDEDKVKLQAMHDRLVQIKQNLDALESSPTAAPQREKTHGARGHDQFFADGAEVLQRLERFQYTERTCLADAERELHLLTQKLPPNEVEGNVDVAKVQRQVDYRERQIAHYDKLIADHQAWMAMPYQERAAINERLWADYLAQGRAEGEKNLKKKAAIAAINLSFIEEENMTPEDRHQATLQKETDDWLNPRMEQRERARNEAAELAAKAEVAEAEREADEPPRKAKKAKGR